MDKYAAGKIEGMLLMILSNLDYVAHHFREASPPEKLRDRMLKIGRAMGEIIDLSRDIYKEHPELKPDLEAQKTAAEHDARYLRTEKPFSPSGM
jgi:hypothetical protein